MRLFMLLVFILSSTVAFASTTSSTTSVATVTKPAIVQYHASLGTIDMNGLKAMMNAHADIVIVDTNIDDWFTGIVIPGAIRLNQEDDDAKILSTLPDKNKVIVTYCGSFKCPASKNFGMRLIKLGYQNVLHYPGGIHEWHDKGNPVEKMPMSQE